MKATWNALHLQIMLFILNERKRRAAERKGGGMGEKKRTDKWTKSWGRMRIWRSEGIEGKGKALDFVYPPPPRQMIRVNVGWPDGS